MPADRPGSVVGVVLAAGASTRMGENKLFLRFEEKTLLRRVVETALAAGLDPVLVVLGHEAERAERELSGLACRIVLHPDYASGQGSSLRAGIAAVPEDCAAAVVLLADMPRVTAEMIAVLLKRYREKRTHLVFSEYGGIQAPPTLYDRSLFPEIRALRGDAGGRQVVLRHRAEASAVAWPPERLADVDTPEDIRGSGLESSEFDPRPAGQRR